MAAANAQAGIARRLPADIHSAPSAGQTATQSRQPVHSAERIVISLSTGSRAGQATAHFAQSMQMSGARLIRAGLKRANRPSSAP